MCGIGAIVSLSEEQVRDGLPRMIVAMRHRGPDANGSALLNSPEVCCGLASTRLAILDLSPAGAQPMVCPKMGNRFLSTAQRHVCSGLCRWRAKSVATGS